MCVCVCVLCCVRVSDYIVYVCKRGIHIFTFPIVIMSSFIVVYNISRPGKKSRIGRRQNVFKMSDEVLVGIFYFAITDLISFFQYQSVCKQWHSCGDRVMQFLAPKFIGITDRGCLAVSSKLRNLVCIHLNDCAITDMGVHNLTNLSALRFLSLQNSVHKRGTLTSDGLQALGSFTQLEVLQLINVCVAEDNGLQLAFLAGLKSLWNLVLEGLKLTDTGLVRLPGIRLRSLSLSSINIDVSTHGLHRILSCLAELQQFYMCNSMWGDHLHIENTADCKQILAELRSLRAITLVDLVLNDVEVEILCSTLPEIRVLRLEIEGQLTDVAARFHFLTTSM